MNLGSVPRFPLDFLNFHCVGLSVGWTSAFVWDECNGEAYLSRKYELGGMGIFT